MRIFGLAAVLLALSFASSARADFTDPCGGWKGPCFYQPDMGLYPYFTDYTVPPDGSFEQWDFWLENDDPLATISLMPPNQVFSVLHYAGAPGWTPGDDPSFLWETTSGPGWLSVRVRGPKSWNNCASPDAVGLCGVEYNIWGNGTVLSVSSAQAGQLRFRSTPLAVPEPGAWAMMLAGLFGLGAVLRARRARGANGLAAARA